MLDTNDLVYEQVKESISDNKFNEMATFVKNQAGFVQKKTVESIAEIAHHL